MSFEYAPARAAAETANVRRRYGPYIDGEYRDAGQWAQTVDPATGEPLAEVPLGRRAEVDAAVAAARGALDGAWGRCSGADRARYLYRLARLVDEGSEALATLETLDSGQPIRESRDRDLPLVAQVLFHYAGWADKLRYAGGRRLPDEPRPAGVTAHLVSDGYPLLALVWKVAPALACGSPVVVRPAPETPLTAFAFAEVCRRAGLPPGTVNVVTGDDETGRLLAGHPDVDVITAVGPVETGRAVASAAAAATGRRVALRLLGPVCNVVFEDAPIDQAVDGIADGLVRRIGYPATRLLVQEPIAERLGDALRRRLARLRVGDPLDANTDVGPLTSDARLALFRDLVAAGGAEAARRWSVTDELPERGFWAAPTVLSGVGLSHRGEPGGPVLAVLTFRTPQEAVEKANALAAGSSPDGAAPATGIWTEKGSRALAVAERLRTDVAWINTTGCFEPGAQQPGEREVGDLRQGGYHGLEAYLG